MATPEIYVDPLIGASPSEVLAMRGGSYDAGSRTSHELALWAPPIQSADMDLLPEKPIMDARVRDTLRNDAYVQNGSHIHKDHIVGEVFLLQSKPNYHVLGLDVVWAGALQEGVETYVTLYDGSVRSY